MDTKFKDFDAWYDKDDITEEYPFIFACKDRENVDSERWVLASLSIDEVKILLEYLQKKLDELKKD